MSGIIEKIQAEIESLKWQVAELNAIIGKQTVDKRGVVLKSPQGHRDEIVERAKRDVAKIIGKYDSFNITIGRFNNQAVTAKFVVNAEKRTVVALIYGYYSKDLYYRGIAKCVPQDCFNAHIGKAIALRRALGLEVPDEYLNAPQPTEVRVGDVVEMQFESFFTKKLVTDKVNPINVCETTIESAAKYFAEGMAKIIDDSRDDGEV